MLKNINFHGGKITYNELNSIDFNEDIESQLNKLSQDLLQVDYGKRYCLDVGWYSDSNLQGCFRIKVIKNYNWSTPIYEKKIYIKEIKSFPQYLEEAIQFIVNLRNPSDPLDLNVHPILSSLDLRGGRVQYDNYDISHYLEFYQQTYSCIKDMVRIDYGPHYFIHLGWAPEFDPTGCFIIQVIKDDDFHHPLFKISVTDIDLLSTSFAKAIKYVHALLKKST